MDKVNTKNGSPQINHQLNKVAEAAFRQLFRKIAFIWDSFNNHGFTKENCQAWKKQENFWTVSMNWKNIGRHGAQLQALSYCIDFMELSPWRKLLVESSCVSGLQLLTRHDNNARHTIGWWEHTTSFDWRVGDLWVQPLQGNRITNPFDALKKHWLF